MDLVSQIIEYESGELSDENTVELFSMLVKSGMAWTLQGCYGRMAERMIDAGVLDEFGKIDYERFTELQQFQNEVIGIVKFDVECPCGMMLEIEEQSIKECPDCSRQLDDRGNIQQ